MYYTADRCHFTLPSILQFRQHCHSLWIKHIKTWYPFPYPFFRENIWGYPFWHIGNVVTLYFNWTSSSMRRVTRCASVMSLRSTKPLTQDYAVIIIAPGTCFNLRHGLLKGVIVKWGGNDVHRTADQANIVSGCAGIWTRLILYSCRWIRKSVLTEYLNKTHMTMPECFFGLFV
jgi:hypothetical protein